MVQFSGQVYGRDFYAFYLASLRVRFYKLVLISAF